MQNAGQRQAEAATVDAKYIQVCDSIALCAMLHCKQAVVVSASDTRHGQVAGFGLRSICKLNRETQAATNGGPQAAERQTRNSTLPQPQRMPASRSIA